MITIKKLVVLALMLAFAVPGQVSAAAAQPQNIGVFLDGKKMAFAENPRMENGTTLVPMRKIFEEQGAKVTWNAASSTVTATKGSIMLTYKIGQRTALKNGRSIALAVPGKVVRGTTLVPLRFVSEALGSSVGWEPMSRIVTIDDSTKQKVTVNRVVDGDTFETTLNGKTEKIRLIGVDTPETVHPTKAVQPYGKQASDFTKKQLEGHTVLIGRDVGERDRYGRVLAYVFLNNGIFYNADLVDRGYARLSTFPPNVKWVELYKVLQQHALTAKLGLWHTAPAAPVVQKPQPVTAPPAAASYQYKTTVQNGYTVKAGLSKVRAVQNDQLKFSANILTASGKAIYPSKMYVKIHYKSKITTYALNQGKVSFQIARASINYPVKIDLVATLNGKAVTFANVQQFTPVK